MSFQRTPAKWVQSIPLSDDVTLHISEKGAVKITEGDAILCMFPGQNLELLHATFMSLTPEVINTVNSYKKQAVMAKEQVRVNKQIEKVKANAIAQVQALHDVAKAAGLDPATYIASILAPKAS